MPVPTILDQPSFAAGKPQGQPTQKSMTKAERRELQEKQRAAKAAAKAQPQPQQGKKDAPAQKQQHPAPAGQAKTKPPPTPLKKTFGAEGAGSKPLASSSKDVANVAGDDTSSKSHGLRIFTHFGQPKPVGHVVKGDIHPAVIRLGLLYSEFKICGANARCIAMLTSFKQVCF